MVRSNLSNKEVYEEIHRKELVRQKKEDASAFEDGLLIENRAVYRKAKLFNSIGMIIGMMILLLLHLIGGGMVGYSLYKEQVFKDCIADASVQGLFSSDNDFSMKGIISHCGYIMNLDEQSLSHAENIWGGE